MKGGEKMQTANVFFNQIQIKPQKNEYPKQQTKEPSQKGFAEVLKDTKNDSSAQVQNQSPKGGQVNNKINQQDKGKGNQSGNKPSAQKPVDRKGNQEVEEQAVQADPQDILELTQVVKGISIEQILIPTENQASNPQTNFSTALPSVQEVMPGLDPGLQPDVPVSNFSELKNNQFAQLMQTALLSDEENLVDDQKTGVALKPQTIPETLIEGQKTTKFSVALENGKNSQQTVGQQPLVPETGIVKPEPSIASQQGKVLEPHLAAVSLEQSTQNKGTQEIEKSRPQEGIKEFWQNLSGKAEVTQVPKTTEIFGGHAEEQGESLADQNNFAQTVSTLFNTNQHNNQRTEAANFHETMKSLENDVLEQVIQKVQVNLKPGQTEMRMQLKPEHLGEIQMKLVVEDGKVTAQFLTNNQGVKETLENSLHHLRQNLQEQGIKVEKLSVLIAGGNLHFNQGRREESFTGNQKSQKNWRRVTNESYEENGIEAIGKVKDQILSADGVDYMA